jgi:riboflavin synthase
MFTGLVQAVGLVRAVQPTPAGLRLTVDAAPWPHRPQAGDSICVSGVCLTAIADAPDGVLAFDAVPETLAKTTLGRLTGGSRVNLEHAVTASTLMGGHVVQGHVDGVGRVDSVRIDDGWRVRICPPHTLAKYLVPKGSVCVDGVSLTVAAVQTPAAPHAGWFEVALIPVTLERTTLAALKPGDEVNIEMDVMAKTIVHYLEHFGVAGTR